MMVHVDTAARAAKLRRKQTVQPQLISVMPAFLDVWISNVMIFMQPALSAERSIMQSAKSDLSVLKTRSTRITWSALSILNCLVLIMPSKACAT